MPGNGSNPSLFIVFSMMLLLASCTPKPKYHGDRVSRPGQTKSPAEQGTAGKQPVQSHVVFTYPIRAFSSRKLTSRYGVRRDPRYNTKEFHHGIDIKAKSGEAVLASAPGTVIFSGKQSGFGRVVIIDHGKRFCTVSAHLSSIRVSEGEHIGRGEVIGTVGRSGNATGTHLHFELRIAGKSVDPLLYLKADAAAQ